MIFKTCCYFKELTYVDYRNLLAIATNRKYIPKEKYKLSYRISMMKSISFFLSVLFLGKFVNNLQSKYLLVHLEEDDTGKYF